MPVLIAVLLGVFAYIAGKAGKPKWALFLGGTGVVVFIGWLASGPGFTILNWFENPSVDLPYDVVEQ